ncbi:MAG: hypothetical protein J6I68_00890 [Butyrivibrio sp.]|uniref:hypothetical protein n=1 Tax=Butyrivibrio sp. TaxID=28121 RepID=UPI001B7C120C|nr:hypothetical protein [Butyrivibrio sp.]MBP3781783.1 hypothetical protein [Butyrivibrio sp.]
MLKIAEFDLLKDDSYTDAILSRLQEDYATEEEIEDGCCYEVSIQDIKFRCAYTDDEMRGIIRTCVKIMKELIDINANGYTKEKFDSYDAFGEESDNSPEHFGKMLDRCKDYETEKLNLLIAEMAEYTRVGGAWFMFIAAPGFRHVIYAIFERMLDDSDDEDMWFSCLYFLIRGAMKMHSDEI